MEDFFDDIKGFFSGILEGIANFFSGLFSDKDEQEDTETFTEEECIDAVNETEILEDTECTCDACVICTNATEDSEPIHMKKDDVVIHIGDIGRLNKLDVEMDGHFLGCKMADECCVDKESIEGGMWQEVDDGNDEGEDKETLNRDSSYMICTNYAGIIYFYDDGQKIRDNQEEILEKSRINQYIEDNKICILSVENREEQVAFLNSILSGAIAEQLRADVPWQVTLCQTALETQWGSKIPIDIYTGIDSNNIFGIKYGGTPLDDPSLYVRAWTKEHVSEDELDYWKKEHSRWALRGEPIRDTGEKDGEGKLIIEVIQPFRVFSSRKESIIEHSEILNNSGYYTDAEAYRDNPYEYLEAIAPIYASDSDYYDNASIIINKYMDWKEKDDQRP